MTAIPCFACKVGTVWDDHACECGFHFDVGELERTAREDMRAAVSRMADHAKSWAVWGPACDTEYGQRWQALYGREVGQ